MAEWAVRLLQQLQRRNFLLFGRKHGTRLGGQPDAPVLANVITTDK